MADISKITVESGTYNIKDAGARTLINQKVTYYTPEEYGAVGDGTTDDTQAIQDMLDAIELTLPTEPSDYQNKDWSGVRIVFSKVYAISSPITISNAYGLVLDKINLIATNNFVGDYLLGFDSVSREITIENSILNGNLRANKCIFLDDYCLVFRIVNCQLTRFAQYGFYANDDQGHEIMIDKCKINQVEWAERNSLSTLVASGTGVYLGTARHDSYMSNTVINYCRDYDLYINGGGANFITDCHFYWSDIVNKGGYNYIKGCYFDGTKLETYGFCYLSDNYFGSDDGNPFIKIAESYTQAWKYDYSYMRGNVFQNKGAAGSITNSIEFDSSWSGHESELKIETIGNTFYDCPLIMYRSPDNVQPEQWKENIWTGNSSDGSCRIGDTLIQWGTIDATDASNYINFPITYTGYTISVQLIKLDNNSSNPFANDITTAHFWANGVSGSVKWVAIGRM